jgi:O-antigen/teichoic acid export membrane protein
MTASRTPADDRDSEAGRRSLRKFVTSARLRRAGWGIGDQALSSVTNFALAVVVARTAGPEGFGAFSVAFGVYAVAISVAQGTSADPLTIRFSAEGATERWRHASRAATGSSLVLGVALGAATAGVGVLLGGITGAALIVLGLGLPALLLQECWRYVFFSARRGAAAFLNDLVWALALTLAFAWVLLVGADDVAVLVAAWIAGAVAGALLGLAQSRLTPDVRRVPTWWREHSDLGIPLTVEALLLSGSRVVVLAGMGLVASLAAVGAVRAAMVLVGALRVVNVGVSLFATPEAVTLVRRSVRSMLRFTVLIGVVLGAVSAAWGALFVVMPEEFGTFLLGSTWADASAVLVPMTVVAAAGGAQMGAVVCLRALARATRSLFARTLTAALQISLGIAGAAAGGARGAAWGLAVAQVVSAAIWWLEAWRATRAVDRAALAGEDVSSSPFDTAGTEAGLP